MKKDAITKINKIGKIGNVITVIMKIVTILSLIICIGLTVFFAGTPEEFLNMKINGDATINVDLSSIGIKLSEKEINEFKKEWEDESTSASFTVNSSELEVNDATVDENGLSIRANGDIMDFSIHNTFFPFLAACIYLIMTIITLVFVGRLCKAFSSCQSPFEENVITKMKHLAFSLIPWVILSSISSGLTEGIVTGKFNITAGINLDTVLVIILIFVLTYIFQYGAVLQQESDETL